MGNLGKKDFSGCDAQRIVYSYQSQAIRDWLDLIYESVNNPENPKINRQNKGINKAANLIDMDNLTPEEEEEKKRGEAAKSKRELYEQAAERNAKIEMIKELYSNNVSINIIAISSGFSENEIKQILEIASDL